MKNKHIVAFVHAKGQSTRVPSKNKKLLGDVPLFVHAIQNALSSRYIGEVVIDSDDEEILQIGESFGATPLKRPSDLANNNTTGDQLAYWQASNRPDSEIVLQVIPTSPFLKGETIDRGIEILLKNPVHSVVGIFQEVVYQWIDDVPIYYKEDGSIPNSFDMAPITYETTGLYINRTPFVLDKKRRMDPKSCLPVLLSKLESIDINTPEDFELASILLAGLQALKK